LERELTPQQFAAWIKAPEGYQLSTTNGDRRLVHESAENLDAVRGPSFSLWIHAAVASVLAAPVNVVFEVEATRARDQPSTLRAGCGRSARARWRGTAMPSQNQERARLNRC